MINVKIINRKILSFILLLLVIFTAVGCEGKNAKETSSEEYKIEFKDDSGRNIKMKEPAKRIISLYSAHTENLFELGLDAEIIGRSKSDLYPPKANLKKIYSYKDDAEAILAAKPDLVLIRPFIERHSSDFVKALENSGINVVSLYPNSFEEFDSYIEKLGMLTGKEERAKELLGNFHNEINNIKEESSKIKNKVKVFFEATETNCRTVTPDSSAAKSIEAAGGINIAKDAKGLNANTSIADYGVERVIEKGNEIEVYVAQKGSMNAGGSPHAISIRPGFDKVKAVANKRIYNIDEKLISSPVFRHVKGISELQRMFYPEIFDDISGFNSNEYLTRDKLAKIIVMFKHKPIITPKSSTYKKKKGHVYGSFEDVDISNPYFDYIETSVLSGYIKYNENSFEPKGKVTREEFAEVLYMLKDFSIKETNIDDINECSNVDIIKTIIGNNIMQLENGKFNPSKAITEKQAVEILKRL